MDHCQCILLWVYIGINVVWENWYAERIYDRVVSIDIIIYIYIYNFPPAVKATVLTGPWYCLMTVPTITYGLGRRKLKVGLTWLHRAGVLRGLLKHQLGVMVSFHLLSLCFTVGLWVTIACLWASILELPMETYGFSSNCYQRPPSH